MVNISATLSCYIIYVQCSRLWKLTQFEHSTFARLCSEVKW